MKLESLLKMLALMRLLMLNGLWLKFWVAAEVWFLFLGKLMKSGFKKFMMLFKKGFRTFHLHTYLDIVIFVDMILMWQMTHWFQGLTLKCWLKNWLNQLNQNFTSQRFWILERELVQLQLLFQKKQIQKWRLLMLAKKHLKLQNPMQWKMMQMWSLFILICLKI